MCNDLDYAKKACKLVQHLLQYGAGNKIGDRYHQNNSIVDVSANRLLRNEYLIAQIQERSEDVSKKNIFQLAVQSILAKTGNCDDHAYIAFCYLAKKRVKDLCVCSEEGHTFVAIGSLYSNKQSPSTIIICDPWLGIVDEAIKYLKSEKEFGYKSKIKNEFYDFDVIIRHDFKDTSGPKKYVKSMQESLSLKKPDKKILQKYFKDIQSDDKSFLNDERSDQHLFNEAIINAQLSQYPTLESLKKDYDVIDKKDINDASKKLEQQIPEEIKRLSQESEKFEKFKDLNKKTYKNYLNEGIEGLSHFGNSAYGVFLYPEPIVYGQPLSEPASPISQEFLDYQDEEDSHPTKKVKKR